MVPARAQDAVQMRQLGSQREGSGGPVAGDQLGGVEKVEGAVGAG